MKKLKTIPKDYIHLFGYLTKILLLCIRFTQRWQDKQPVYLRIIINNFKYKKQWI